jgi:hypothetical protein
MTIWPDGDRAYPGLSTEQMKVGFHHQSHPWKNMDIFLTHAGKEWHVKTLTAGEPGTTPISWELILKSVPNPGFAPGSHRLYFYGSRSNNKYSFDTPNFWRVFAGKWVLFDWVVAP